MVAHHTYSWCLTVDDALNRNNLIAEGGSERHQVRLAWEPGPRGWVTMHSDDNVNRAAGKASAGGLVRDSDGRCILDYTMNIDNCSLTRAEMRGAIEGLNRTWNAGFRRVVLRLDSKAAIALLNNISNTSHQHGLESLSFQELRDREWELVVEHTYMEGNHVDDYLASIGYDYPFGSHTVSISDSNLVYFIRSDCMDIS
ncbi:Putative ribonuclease H protein At1g65750 [Linum perenne]